jgi:hypothetical protein
MSEWIKDVRHNCYMELINPWYTLELKAIDRKISANASAGKAGLYR